jgi:hypothetical protein
MASLSFTFTNSVTIKSVKGTRHIYGELIVNVSESGFYPSLLVSEERAFPIEGSSPLHLQPFLRNSVLHRVDRFAMNLTREQGSWANAMSKEQTAYALAQVSASQVLPQLVELDTGNEVLEYRVHLRDFLDSTLVAELVHVLDSCGEELHWGQVDSNIYAAVIGAGVAACIDTTPQHETLYFRCANALVSQLNNAHHAAELPRSLLFLQTALYERFDVILDQIRNRMWFWLIG